MTMYAYMVISIVLLLCSGYLPPLHAFTNARVYQPSPIKAPNNRNSLPWLQYSIRPSTLAAASTEQSVSVKAPTERTVAVFDRIDQVENAGGAGGSSSLKGLVTLDKVWHNLRHGGWRNAPPSIVSVSSDASDAFDSFSVDLSKQHDYDIIVCGGTLGIFYATAMQKMGYRVCVLERGKVLGRPQEWNISRKELGALIRLNILNEEDIDAVLGIEFNPVRVGFKTDTSPESTKAGYEVYVRDILNLGVRPDLLIEMTKNRFIEAGGTVLEGASLGTINVHRTGADVSYSTTAPLSSNTDTTTPSMTTSTITSRIVIDAMGNGSPISRQIRGSVEPDGICVVVGTCARGYNADNNTYSDVIYTDTPITKKNDDSQLQYFWEAFPAGSGAQDRTTYLFTYMDAKPERPSITEIIDDYWDLLPRYQGVSVEDLEFIRVLYGMFPTYRASPLKTPFPRVLQVGDASGIQSPLSFGGFGSLTRHLERITSSLKEALDNNLLDASDLSLINAYQPNLSACWMFQRAMSVPIGRDPPSNELVVDTLTNSFSAMEKLGEETMNPFLQDVLQFGPLFRTLLLAGKQDLLTPLKIVPHVGIVAFLDFLWHFSATGVYTLLYKLLGDAVLEYSSSSSSTSTDMTPRKRFELKRMVEAWKFGSGMDYYDHHN